MVFLCERVAPAVVTVQTEVRERVQTDPMFDWFFGGTPQQSRAIAQGSEIRVARSRSADSPNLEFHVADATLWDFPAAHFDYIATIATLHHLPLRAMILKLKAALKPGGVLIVLDLFEPVGKLDREEIEEAGAAQRDGALIIATQFIEPDPRVDLVDERVRR